MQELLFNTAKHSGTTKAKVAVSSIEDSITVTVSDQGRGFVLQGVQECRDKPGFGLLTIKERANYIGGKFTMESSLGQGSRFTLTVPNVAAYAYDDRPNGESAVEGFKERSTESESGKPGTRVLFADDHHVMRQGLIKLVKGQPEIRIAGEAANGLEAIEQARALNPDVIVMDISMPRMDGIEATRRIKAELPNIRIIGLTMHDDPQLSASMMEAGAEVILRKTTSAAALVKAIYGSH